MEIQELKDENDKQHTEIKGSIKDLADKLDQAAVTIATLTGKSDTVKMLLIYVVVPLLFILGGLVGIKIALPSA